MTRTFEVLYRRRNDAESINRHLDDTLWISEEAVPHEREDESDIYPGIAECLGGNDPLAPMRTAARRARSSTPSTRFSVCTSPRKRSC
jgi:hypothetical protein